MSRCILVLGVQGSGTSAVAGVLHHLGVMMGEKLVGPGRGNPKGHFEDAVFRTLLYSLRNPQLNALMGDLIVRFLEERYQKYALWGLKEPNINAVIDKLGIYFSKRGCRVIVTERDPNACARSGLVKWPQMSLTEILAEHEALRRKRQEFLATYRPPTLWVEYNDLTERPEEFVRLIARFAFDGLPAPDDRQLAEAIDFVDPNLNHYRELDTITAESDPGKNA